MTGILSLLTRRGRNLSVCASCPDRVDGPMGSVCGLCYCRIEKKATENDCPAGRFGP